MDIFFPEQVDPAAGMSERATAREPGRPARSSPAARATQNPRHDRAGIALKRSHPWVVDPHRYNADPDPVKKFKFGKFTAGKRFIFF